MAVIGGEYTPVPKSPARKAADAARKEYVKCWLQDLGGGIADAAEDICEKLAAAGYSSKRSLRLLQDADAVADEFGLSAGVAGELVLEARLMHTRATMTAAGVVAQKPWEGLSAMLKGGSGAGALAAPTREGVQAFNRKFIPYVQGRDVHGATALQVKVLG